MIHKTTLRLALALLLLSPSAAFAQGGKSHGKREAHAKEAKGKPEDKGKSEHKGKPEDKDKHDDKGKHDDEGKHDEGKHDEGKHDEGKPEDKGKHDKDKRGEHGEPEERGEHGAKGAKRGAPDAAKLNAEQRKHIKNNARIDRLEELAKEKDNSKLSERIPTLRDKEKRRHEKAMSRLQPADAPAADAPAPVDAPQ